VIRAATRADSDLLLAWRNDPGTRAASRGQESVAAAGHERWLEDVLADDDRALLVGERRGEPVGQLRFDRVDALRWEISVTVAPEARGRGIGRALIEAGIDWLWSTEPCARVVEAWVRRGNDRSLRAFAACGFEREGSEADMTRLELRRG
jgi:RimJ/RimL family protein N-acetyltransferase